MDADRHRQFAQRMVRNQQRVFAYIVSLVPNRADAEELFQQTCLTLWEHWDRYDSSLDFVPWACGIAHNHVRNFLRKRQNSQVPLDADVLEMLAVRSQQMQQREGDRTAALRECLRELTERNRDAVESYYGGRSVAEIAKTRDTTPNAIYRLLDRTRAVLHRCVSNRLAAEGAL